MASPLLDSAVPKRSIFSLFVIFIFLFSLIIFSISYLFVAARGGSAISELHKQGYHATRQAQADRLTAFIDDRVQVLKDLAATPLVTSAALLSSAENADLSDFMESATILGQRQKLVLSNINADVIYENAVARHGKFGPKTQWFAGLVDGTSAYDVRLMRSTELEDKRCLMISVPVLYHGNPEGVLTAELRLIRDLSGIFGDTVRDTRSAITLSKDGVSLSSTTRQFEKPVEGTVAIEKYGIALTHVVDDAEAAAAQGKLMLEIAAGLGLSAIVAFVFFWFFGNQIIVAPYDRLAELQTGISNSAEGIAKVNSDRRIEFANTAYAASLDADVGDIVGKRWPEVIEDTSTHPVLLAAMKHIEDARRTSFEVTYQSPSGRRLDKLMTLVRSEGGRDGAQPGFYVFEVDIAARVSMERKLKEAAHNLKRSNADLQRFAFAASHDLKEPLRKIEMCCSLLASDYKEELDEEGRELVDIAADGSNRMRRLIDDLLALSRINTRDLVFVETSLNKPLNDALANLQSQIAESGANIESGPLPQLPVVPGLIRQLFQNLISNAIRYRSEAPPQVIVDAEELDDCWQIAIADNGVGIAPEYAKKIFAAFERLDQQSLSDPSGTGIGLALCKQIIERHNGRIWLSTDYTEGSRFVIELPKHQSLEGDEAKAA